MLANNNFRHIETFLVIAALYPGLAFLFRSLCAAPGAMLLEPRRHDP